MAKRPRRTFLVKQARKASRKRAAIPDEKTPHYWWWQFLRRNRDYLKCCENGGKGRLKSLYDDFGDVREDAYRKWLSAVMPSGETRKYHLFAELPNPFNRDSVVTLETTNDWDQAYQDHGYLLVAVNMREKSRESLKNAFAIWLKNEPRAPNTQTSEERTALVETRRYEYVTVNGKRKRIVRDKNVPKELKLKPLPPKEQLSGRRGRRPLAVYKDVVDNGEIVKKRVGSVSTARYPIYQNYSVKNLRDMLAVVDAVDRARQEDAERAELKKRLLPIRKSLVALRHYQSHKLIAGNKADEQRVAREFAAIYSQASAVLGSNLSTAEMDARLEEAWMNRRNRETTTYPMIGKRLIKELGWRNQHDDTQSRWLTRKINELYTRGKAVIANTSRGEFPRDT
jgi:hypothetical protein